MQYISSEQLNIFYNKLNIKQIINITFYHNVIKKFHKSGQNINYMMDH
jgi:hypothetical protein